MRSFDNIFEEAMNRADGHIIRTMGKDVALYIDGERRIIRAVFDNPDAPSSLPRGAAYIQDTAPTIFAFTEDMTGLKEGHLVEAEGNEYRVVRVKPSDTGCTTAVLGVGKGAGAVPQIEGKWSKPR